MTEYTCDSFRFFNLFPVYFGGKGTIADRVGHESIDITYRYAHLFPTRQAEMADKLDMERKGA